MIMFFRVKSSSRLIARSQRFGQASCLHLQGWSDGIYHTLFQKYITSNDFLFLTNESNIMRYDVTGAQFHVAWIHAINTHRYNSLQPTKPMTPAGRTYLLYCITESYKATFVFPLYIFSPVLLYFFFLFNPLFSHHTDSYESQFPFYSHTSHIFILQWTCIFQYPRERDLKYSLWL